jgi:hypothetical protein
MLTANPFINFQISSAVPQNTAEKILSFRNLPLGWHYGNGGPIDDAVIASAIQLYWLMLQNRLINTDAFPGADGEIQLTAYHTALDGNRHYIGIMIEPTGELSLVYEIDGQDGRQPIEAADLETVKTTLREIAGSIAGRQWNTSDIFTQKTSTILAGVLPKSPSKNQAWTVALPSSGEIVSTIWATTTASTPGTFIPLPLFGSPQYFGSLTK